MSTFRSRFPAVAALLSGASAAATPATPPAPPAAENPTPDPAANTEAIEAAIAAETDKIVAESVKGERDRWQAVLSDDVGSANSKVAVSLLSRTDMSAADVLATLKDMTPAAAPQSNRVTERLGQLDRGSAAPKTGTAPGASEEGDGTGQDGEDRYAVLNKQRAARAAKAKANAEAKGERFANAA